MGIYIKILLLAMGMVHFPLKALEYFALDGGVYQSQLREYQRVSESNRGEVSDFSPFLRTRAGWSLGKKWHTELSLATAIPWKTGADGSVKKFSFYGSSLLGFSLFSFWRFKAGPGLRMQWFHSSAEGVTLNNGNSSSTFYLPQRDVQVWNLLASFSMEFLLSKKWTLSMDAHVLGVLSASLRNYDVMVSVGYRL